MRTNINSGCARRTALSIGVAVALAFSVAGCSTEGPPTIVLGTGFFEFEPLKDNGSVSIVRGPQGGYHIWISVRGRYIAPESLKLCLTLDLADTGEQLEKVTTVVDLILPDGSQEAGGAGSSHDGWGESLGNRLFVPSPEQIDGKLVRINVEAMGRDGRVAHDSKVVISKL